MQSTRGYLQVTQVGRGRKFCTAPLMKIAVVRPLRLLAATCCGIPKSQCEIALMWERVYPRVETCKQSFRGAVLVPNTYGWDTLAATVVRRSQTAHCSHLRSRVSVGLEAPKGNHERAAERGEERSRPSGAMFLTLPDQATSLLTRHRSPGLCQPAARARPTSIFLPETQ